MTDYLSFVDWLVSAISRWWSFWMAQHFIFKSLLLCPFLLMVVGLIYNTFHSDV